MALRIISHVRDCKLLCCRVISNLVPELHTTKLSTSKDLFAAKLKTSSCHSCHTVRHTHWSVAPQRQIAPCAYLSITPQSKSCAHQIVTQQGTQQPHSTQISACSTDQAHTDKQSVQEKMAKHSKLKLENDTSSLSSRVLSAVGFPVFKYKRWVLRRTGTRLYLCAVEIIDKDAFFKEFDMPDWFVSMFQIFALHIWLISVRLDKEGVDGKAVKHEMIKTMWQDLEIRMRKLGDEVTPKTRKENLRKMYASMTHSFDKYDEALATNDEVALNTALLNTFFINSKAKPEQVEVLRKYVRRQIEHLNNVDSTALMTTGLVTFTNLNDATFDTKKNKFVLQEICRRV